MQKQRITWLNAIWEAEMICTPQGVPYVHQLYGYPVAPGTSRLNVWVPLQPILDYSTVALEEARSVNERAKSVTVNVTLSPADPNQTVEISWATADDTAIAGTHYTAASGTLTFSPGETLKTITIELLGVNIASFVQFQIVLTNPVNANLGNAVAIVTIIPDLGST
jgi:Calx-beta domain.